MKFILFLLTTFFMVQSFAAEDIAKIVCTDCHSDLVESKFVHGPLKTNGCIHCHQVVAAGAKSKKLPDDHPSVSLDTGKNQAAVCLKCHSVWGKTFKARKNAHTAISKNGCTSCHSPHGSSNPKMLKNKEANQALCFGCHKKNENWEKGDRPTAHDPVNSDDKCFNCHEVHSSNLPKLLKQEAPALCATCHELPAKKAKGSIHTPVKNGECLSCHSPHYGKGKLLTQSYEADGYVKSMESSFQLCLGCHDLDSMDKFNNGSKNLHKLHISKKMDGKERGCSVCHVAHDSDQEMQIRSSSIYNKISLPLVFQKQANGGTCTTACHGKKDYNRVTPVTNKEGR